MNLHDLQRAFSNTIFDGGDKQVHACIKGSSNEAKDKRLDIYRNNVFYSLTNALADLYPVIKRLVGEQFFNATAAAYIRQCPPQSAAMVNYAADFPEFLQGFEHTAGLAYLVDVASLELAWHEAYHAEDAVTLSLTDIAALQPEQLRQAKLLLHPSVRLLKSSFPVLKIWNANQDDQPNDEPIDLDSGGTIVCIWRPGYDVQIREIDGATCTLLQSLRDNDTLETAMANAGSTDSILAMPERFALCIRDGFFRKIIGN